MTEKSMFELAFAGTCAYDFSPLLKTEFADRLDKNVRRSSSLLVDGRLLIDCGPHTPHALELLGERGVTDLLLTHLHCDHFDPASVAALAAQCEQPLNVWYRAGAQLPELERVRLHPVEPMQCFSAAGITVTALPANHSHFPLHYALQKGDRRLFYGTDGAWFLSETFNYLRDKRFDFFVFDGTVGDYDGDYRIFEHNSIPMLRTMLPTLRRKNVFAPDALLYLTHLAPSLHLPHDETVALLRADGLHVAFDGERLSI